MGTEPLSPDAQTTVIVNKVENRQGGYFELRDDPPSGDSNFIYAVTGEVFRTYTIGDRYYIPVDMIDRDTQPSNELAIIGGSAGIFAVLFLGSFWWERRCRSVLDSS
jgi:hypothetical protein